MRRNHLRLLLCFYTLQDAELHGTPLSQRLFPPVQRFTKPNNKNTKTVWLGSTSSRDINGISCDDKKSTFDQGCITPPRSKVVNLLNEMLQLRATSIIYMSFINSQNCLFLSENSWISWKLKASYSAFSSSNNLFCFSRTALSSIRHLILCNYSLMKITNVVGIC